MKPRVWKDRKRGIWATSYGPQNQYIAYYNQWWRALNWANRYGHLYHQEPTC